MRCSHWAYPIHLITRGVKAVRDAPRSRGRSPQGAPLGIQPRQTKLHCAGRQPVACRPSILSRDNISATTGGPVVVELKILRGDLASQYRTIAVCGLEFVLHCPVCGNRDSLFASGERCRSKRQRTLSMPKNQKSFVWHSAKQIFSRPSSKTVSEWSL